MTTTDVLVYGVQAPLVHPEIVKVLHEFYKDYYKTYKERNDGTGDASKVVALSQLLEGEDGLLHSIISRKQFTPLFVKKNEGANSPYSFEGRAAVIRNGGYCSKLVAAVRQFQHHRNQIVHPLRYPVPQNVDAIAKSFLTIVEEYYLTYRPGKTAQSIYDLSVYRKQLGAGVSLMGRYDIVQYLGKNDGANVYKVKDRTEPGRVAMSAKFAFDMTQEMKIGLERERNFGAMSQQSGMLPYLNEYLGSEAFGKNSMIVFRRFIEGGGLTSWFSKGYENKDFPYRLMCLVGTLLQGLRGIHETGYVYGAMLPQNIVVDSHDQGWLIEFTRAVKIGEKLATIPQEDWKKYGMKKTPATAHPSYDIHMLGMIMHRLLVRAESSDIHKLLHKDQVLPVYKDYVSDEVIDFINCCTSENQAKNYRSGREALDAWNLAFEKQTAHVEKRGTGPVKYGIVSCSRRKTATDKSIPARELYSASPDFQRWLRWSEKQCDKTFIISGKYGLVEPGQSLPYYDVDLRHYPSEGREAWARFIVYALLNQGLSNLCEVHICADSLYRTLLLAELERHNIRVVEHEWKDEMVAT